MAIKIISTDIKVPVESEQALLAHLQDINGEDRSLDLWEILNEYYGWHYTIDPTDRLFIDFYPKTYTMSQIELERFLSDIADFVESGWVKVCYDEEDFLLGRYVVRRGNVYEETAEIIYTYSKPIKRPD